MTTVVFKGLIRRKQSCYSKTKMARYTQLQHSTVMSLVKRIWKIFGVALVRRGGEYNYDYVVQ